MCVFNTCLRSRVFLQDKVRGAITAAKELFIRSPPSELPAPVLDMIQHLSTLDYADKPDYPYLARCLFRLDPDTFHADFCQVGFLRLCSVVLLFSLVCRPSLALHVSHFNYVVFQFAFVS